MKHQQYTTAEPILGAIGTWAMSLFQLHQRLGPYFARPEVRAHALLYLQAILSEIPRKNSWQIAEYARQARPYGMQRLLARAVWDEAGVRDELRALVCQSLSPPPLVPAAAECEPLYPVFVIDESSRSKTSLRVHSFAVSNRNSLKIRSDSCLSPLVKDVLSVFFLPMSCVCSGIFDFK